MDVHKVPYSTDSTAISSVSEMTSRSTESNASHAPVSHCRNTSNEDFETLPLAPRPRRPYTPDQSLQLHHSQKLSVLGDIRRDAPRDSLANTMTSPAKHEPEEGLTAKKRSQLYGELFAYHEPLADARERVSRESVITAEVKTNVIVRRKSLISVSFPPHLASILPQFSPPASL